MLLLARYVRFAENITKENTHAEDPETEGCTKILPSKLWKTENVASSYMTALLTR